mmetsp:Transcript_1596/g.4511  ORF Transcript_1596/g.4511 Transcript_1596/m.4511 type:complete len:237 (-) Transcript_1596:274-984(-)
MLPRFRLWHSVDARSFRILWAFEELGLKRGRDYAMRVMPFPPREKEPGFLRINPLGTVPWFEHKELHDVEPRASMSESCAVPLYLTSYIDRPYLGVHRTDKEHGAFVNWLFHADATLTFPQAVVMRYGVFEPGVAEAAADGYAKWFVARLRLLNLALEDGRNYLCSDRMTMADVCIAYALYNASEHGLCGSGMMSVGKDPLSSFYKPCTHEYLRRMMERPAWKAAQNEQAVAVPDF